MAELKSKEFNLIFIHSLLTFLVVWISLNFEEDSSNAGFYLPVLLSGRSVCYYA